MNYVFYVDSNPDSNTYRQPLGLFRYSMDGAFTCQRWDIPDGKWVDDFVAFRSMSGIGGDGGEWQWVDKDKADAFLAQAGKAGSSDVKALMSRLDALRVELHQAVEVVNREAEQEKARGLGFMARLFGRRD